MADFCGKPLLYWTIKQSIESKNIHKTFVSTEDNYIAEYCKNTFPEITIIKRPEMLIPTGISWEMVWSHAIEEIKKEFDIDTFISLCIANPVRRSYDIDRAISTYWDNNHEGNMVKGCLFSACIENDLRLWNKDLRSGHTFSYPNGRNKMGEYYRENESIYVIDVKGFEYYKMRYWGNPSVYIMPYWASSTIDIIEDLKLCELIFKYFILKEKET